MANAFVTGAVRLTMPESLRVELRGSLPPGLTAKDVVQGYLATFEAVGAELLQRACGACANCGPGASTLSQQVTVSAINRNFPGRSGPGAV